MAVHGWGCRRDLPNAKAGDEITIAGLFIPD
jgi:hypothetical protein